MSIGEISIVYYKAKRQSFSLADINIGVSENIDPLVPICTLARDTIFLAQVAVTCHNHQLLLLGDKVLICPSIPKLQFYHRYYNTFLDRPYRTMQHSYTLQDLIIISRVVFSLNLLLFVILFFLYVLVQNSFNSVIECLCLISQCSNGVCQEYFCDVTGVPFPVLCCLQAAQLTYLLRKIHWQNHFGILHSQCVKILYNLINF